MVKLSVTKLIPGLVLAMDVVAYNGQTILEKNLVLTDKSITKLAFYAVVSVQLKTNAEGKLIKEKVSEPVHESLRDKTVHSPEFKAYKQTFDNTKNTYEAAVNDIVTHHKTLDTRALVTHVLDLFMKSSSASSIFDMLHSMREYDDSTYTHCINVSLICVVFGQWLGMSDEDIEKLSLAGLLHDVGKLLIPEEIVKKPAKLTDDEFEVMKTHPYKGYELFKNTPLDSHVKNAILMHHEKCDGSGYPYGLESDAIDPFAKIVSIADIYDATTSARIYRGPLSPFEVIDLFQQEGYQKYDPRYIMTFMEHVVDTYIGQDVLLSNDEVATVMFINKANPGRPIVKTKRDCYDLSKRKDLSVLKIV